MVNQSPEYHEGFSKGYHELPCEGMRSAEFQAGWLDGSRQLTTTIELVNGRSTGICEECGGDCE
jgi:hypothetical protein